ncbi:MAG: TfuA domain-containing protein [Novosphingobium sp.]|nr:TfuA domain-containing protein [Novosphingobium sp.]
MRRYDPGVIRVFAGPSLAGWVAASPFVRHPPVAACDLLQLLGGDACTVVLIDGYFDSRRAVWHKEVLQLMAAGFRMIGAASMGALRAAELAPFGMIGTGAIARAYTSGQITGDDEVAVVHAPVAMGARPLSLAQIDARHVLVRAARAGVLPVFAARQLRELSSRIHFRDRTWDAAIVTGRAAGLSLDSFERWLPANSRSLKEADASAALELALTLAPSPPLPRPEPPRTCYLTDAAAFAGVVL